jgi:hypothetical protein
MPVIRFRMALLAFSEPLSFLPDAATKISRDNALSCVKRSEKSKTNKEQKGLTND